MKYEDLNKYIHDHGKVCGDYRFVTGIVLRYDKPGEGGECTSYNPKKVGDTLLSRRAWKSNEYDIRVLGDCFDVTVTYRDLDFSNIRGIVDCCFTFARELEKTSGLCIGDITFCFGRVLKRYYSPDITPLSLVYVERT